MKNLFDLKILFGLFLCLNSMVTRAEANERSSNTVSVIIPDTSEVESVTLKSYQVAQVKVYLSSLGDTMDKYMVSLVDTNLNTVVANLVSDESGEVIFKKLPPGTYALSLNRKVAFEEQEHSTVKIGDVVIKAYP